MNLKKTLFGLGLFLLSLPAYAIPPPEAVISLWQSLLQFLGVASVFAGAAILSMRQFFGLYIVGWKRVAFYLSLGVVSAWLLWFFLGSQVAKAKPVRHILGELVSINELLKREEDDWIREWKLGTTEEMKNELALARQSRGLPKPTFGVVQSFTAKRLSQLIKTQRKDIYLLDIREGFERSRFGIPVDGSARYGDIAGNILPANLPKNTVIVVLCHSGLRGFFGANLLNVAGYSRAAFLQGGLAEWSKQQLPVHGNPDYTAKKRWLPNKKEAVALKALKLQVDSEGSKLVTGLPGLISFPYETATSRDIARILQSAKARPILLACNTYGGCFQSTNMAWLIEKKGGTVAGIYDETGEHMEHFFD